MSKRKNSKLKMPIVITVILCVCIAVTAVILKTADKEEPVLDAVDSAVESAPVSETEKSGSEKEETTVSEVADPVPEDPPEKPEPVITVTDMSAVMYPTIRDLNVRSAAGSNSEIIATVGNDNALNVTGKSSNGWFRIDYNGKTGYCYGKYLSTEKKAEQSEQNEYPYFIRVNRAQNIVIIFTTDENGEYTVPVKAMTCSVGTDGKTPTGTYSLSSKYVWGSLSGGVYGQYCSRINGPYLFHSVPYFSKDKGNLEYEEYNKLGQAASLGCVRLAVIDAKWIYDNCRKGTKVTIYDSAEPEPLSKPVPVTIDTEDPRRGWDPTDPDPDNPW